MRLLPFFLAVLLPAAAALAQASAAQPATAVAKAGVWGEGTRKDFAFEDTTAILIQPKTAAPGKPWIWRTEFFGHEPQADAALVAKGWHVAYVKVSDQYGAPAAIEKMGRFYQQVVQEHGLAPKAVLEGFSRGGLYAVNFAATYPERTAALYLDAPVLDLRSWPAGLGKGKGNTANYQQALAVYGVKEFSEDFSGSPITKAALLAKARIPVLSVCGDADDVVPLPENTEVFRQRYEAAGGKLELIVKPGVGHHPHSLQDPAPIVQWILRVTAP